MLLGFPYHNRVALLEDFMDCDQSLECLHFVGENGLAVDIRLRLIKDVRDALFRVFRFVFSSWTISSQGRVFAREKGVQCSTYTFMPAQKAAEDLWSHV